MLEIHTEGQYCVGEPIKHWIYCGEGKQVIWQILSGNVTIDNFTGNPIEATPQDEAGYVLTAFCCEII